MTSDNKQKNTAIVARMKAALGVGNDIELARILRIKSQGISKAKSGRVPDAWYDKVVTKSGCRRDWLITGEGSMVISESENAPEQSDDKKAPRIGAMSPDAEPMPGKELAEGFSMLGKIYNSGSKTLIRAINSNLAAFCEAIDNKELAVSTNAKFDAASAKLDEMAHRLLSVENGHRKLEMENATLKRRLDGQGAASG